MSLRQAMLDLMRAITDDIAVQEAVACEISDVAAEKEAAGYAREAATMRTLSRRHRVAGIELQARLVTLSGEYATMFPDAKLDGFT
ncbi:hypothetical protein [Methylobacterium frigidaeris]|uniref:Uncharacterized protein n=1 Tax=Methylobacterium frigidaeris TaxID=2038277 RepID=A0AA37M8N1_9HYPH|nr:hypothetical protein [Methylobacterium frigidaeris]GJD66998.1 hypothetical protein MPEAHAMD_7197 [Methylobacterium frigidaeris]